MLHAAKLRVCYASYYAEVTAIQYATRLCQLPNHHHMPLRHCCHYAATLDITTPLLLLSAAVSLL